MAEDGNDTESILQIALYCFLRGEYEQARNLFGLILGNNPGHQLAQLAFFASQELTTAQITIFERLSCYAKRETADRPGTLISLNGDLMWFPTELLSYIWHTLNQPMTGLIPAFSAETEHYLWTRERLPEGANVFDVGASLGLFATMMSKRVGAKGRVIAFEPHPTTRTDLLSVLQLNRCENVTVEPFAVATAPGMARFAAIGATTVQREASHLLAPGELRPHTPETTDFLEVRTTSIDDYVQVSGIKPDLIKVDIEGAEMALLAGAHDTLTKIAPLLVLEIHADAHTGIFDYDALHTLLERYNYSYRHELKICYCEPKESAP